MRYEFTSDQLLFRDNIRRFGKEWGSVARARERESAQPPDAAFARAMNQMGLPAVLVPEEHGGLGLSMLDMVLALEESGYGVFPDETVPMVVCTDLVGALAGESQKAALLPEMASGNLKLACAYQAVDAPVSARLGYRAERAQGGWRLAGEAGCMAGVDAADRILLVANMPSGDEGVFMVDKARVSEGMREEAQIDITARLHRLRLSGLVLGEEALLGGAASRAVLPRVMTTGALAAAAEMLGASARAFEMALDHVKTRTQFGQTLGAQQAIKHRLADMYTALEGMRTITYAAAWAVATGTDADRTVSMAKAFNGESSMMICNESHQLHGGIGFTWAHDLHLFMKRCKRLEVMYGTAFWHRERCLGDVLAALEAEAA